MSKNHNHRSSRAEFYNSSPSALVSGGGPANNDNSDAILSCPELGVESAKDQNLDANFSGPELGMAFLNCGKRCGDIACQIDVIDSVANVLPHWAVIYLSEVDAVRRSLPSNDYPTHSSFRHWPGEGSYAMMFMVRNSYRTLIRNITWRGRAGAIHLFQKNQGTDDHTSIYIIGLHSHHGALQIDTFADVAFLLRHRPWGSKVLVAGDWNVDQLPALADDPYAQNEGRAFHHQAERVLLHTLADRFRLTVTLPDMVCSTPGGPFDHICAMAPISRIPTGECVEYSLPSLLDYGLSSSRFVKASKLHWEGAPADHGFVTFSLDPTSVLRRGTKTNWKCKNRDECLNWICNNAPDNFEDIQSLHSFLLEIQRVWADSRTCKDRREARLPDSLRSLYNTIANTTSEIERQRLQKEAWEIRRNICEDQRTVKLAETVQRGRVLQKSKKLHQVEAVVLSSGHPAKINQVSYNEEEWRAEIDEHFFAEMGSTATSRKGKHFQILSRSRRPRHGIFCC